MAIVRAYKIPRIDKGIYHKRFNKVIEFVSSHRCSHTDIDSLFPSIIQFHLPIDYTRLE